MTTAREYLVERDLAKPGRGKFSKVAHAALEKALAEGVKFSDYPKAGKPAPVKSTAPKVEKAVGQKSETKPANTGKAIAEILFEDEYRYPEKEYRAVSFNDGKKVIHSMREVCTNCGQSLVMCSCGAPTLYGGRIKVKIEMR